VEEFEKLCDKMQWQEGWTWQDMPVEMAHLLYDRVQIFLRDHQPVAPHQPHPGPHQGVHHPLGEPGEVAASLLHALATWCSHQ
jgi:hypothetical protein